MLEILAMRAIVQNNKFFSSLAKTKNLCYTENVILF